MHKDARRRNYMINSVSNQGYTSPYSAKQYLSNELNTTQTPGKNNPSGSLLYTSDTVTLGSSSETSATYSKSLSLNAAKGDGFNMLRGLVLNKALIRKSPMATVQLISARSLRKTPRN